MENYNELISKFHYFLNECDAILVGAGSGMSSASGFTHYYERSEEFVKWFGDFEKKYGFTSSFNGAYYRYSSEEERYAFFIRFIKCILQEELGESYSQIKEILKNKEFHILTTNQDTQFNKIYPESKISAIQGDWRFLQCSRACTDELYDSKLLSDLNDKIDKETLKIENSLLPRCPHCKSLLFPWVRDPRFLEGSRYKDEYRKVQEFLDKYKNKKIMFLELGVGRMTPMFIQEPFWNLTYALNKAIYVTINPKDVLIPLEIRNKSIGIKEDICKVFNDVIKLGEINGK